MLDHARSEISPLPALAFQVSQGRDCPFPTAGAPLAAAFDLLRMSVVLTNGSGEILYANRYARAMFKEQRCLRIGQGKISAVNPKCASHLKQAIRRCASGEPGALPLGIAVPLSRTDEPTIAAWVLPIRSQCDDEQRQAAIFIRNAADLFSEDMFASTFSVTLGELRVLKLLFSGRCIEEISRTLKLSRNTVRTHVKALFAKTGTTRQAELLRLACFSIAPASAEALA